MSVQNRTLQKRPSLPLAPELLAKIFGKLAVRDLACAEIVCKDWFDIIKAYSFWSQHAAQCCPAQGCHMASQQPAHPYDLLEAKQEVANHVVATRLEKSPPKLMKLEGHTAAITSCSAGPGIIASASEDKTVRLWQQSPGRPGWACTSVLKHRHAPQAVEVIAPSLILTTSQADVLLWRNSTLARRFQVPGRSSDLCHLGCKDGMVVGAAAGSGQLRVWDLYSGSLQQLLRPAEAAITSLQLVDSPSGSPACLAATGHADGSCVFLDLGSGSQALTLPGQWRHRPSSNGAKDEQDGRNQPAFISVAQSRPLSVVGQHHCLRGWDLRFLKGPLWLNPLGRPAPYQMTIPNPGNQHLAIPMDFLMPCVQSKAPALYNLLDGTAINMQVPKKAANGVLSADACIASYGSRIVSAQKHVGTWSLSVWSYQGQK